MFILYDLIFLIFSLFYLPVYLLKGKFHKGFSERFGFLPFKTGLDNPIWVHAVSVGEAKAVKNLLDSMRVLYPGKKFVISTVTPTGNKIVRSYAGTNDLVIYLPLDFSFIVNSVIKRIKPAIFIIAETEIWPNLLTCLKHKGIPIAVVNARISDHSYKGYLMARPLLKSIFNKPSIFCAQSQRDADRLIFLGVEKDKVRVTGNLKFDFLSDSEELLKRRNELRKSLQFLPDEKILVAGSTHPGEETLIIECYKNLAREFKGLRLVLAPRHPERAKDVASIVSGSGFNPVLSSKQKAKCLACIPVEVVIVDVIGKLMDYYAVADIVFVGGSLIKKGGQNILEPASLAKPVIFGPHMFNFRDITDLFLKDNACIMVHNSQELETAVRDLMNDPALAQGLGQRAKELILSNQGATERTVKLLTAYV